MNLTCKGTQMPTVAIGPPSLYQCIILKRQVMGREVVVAVTKGKLDFGPWERIFYSEFDGFLAHIAIRTVVAAVEGLVGR